MMLSLSDSGDDFDPFGLKAELTREDSTGIAPPPQVSRIHHQQHVTPTSRPSVASLPPKLVVRLSIEEQVSSVAKVDTEGCSDVAIEGIIYASVQCSDAGRNARFVLAPPGAGVRLSPQAPYSRERQGQIVVDIPKHEIGLVPIAHYTVEQQVEHMPILVERKTTVHDKNVRVAVQVRSKLTNTGNMTDFSIGIAVPEHVIGDTLEILRGNGQWDELKRMLKYKLAELQKGESFMVSAQGKLWTPTPDINFPVLLRCTAAADAISEMDWQVVADKEDPSSISMTKSHAFRLLHRLV